MKSFLWKDSVHLTNNRIFVFACNAPNFLSNFILTNDGLLKICTATQTDDPKIKKKLDKLNSETSMHNKKGTKKDSGQGSETLLWNLRVENYNKVLNGHLNANPNKFDQLKAVEENKLDVLVINETKID